MKENKTWFSVPVLNDPVVTGYVLIALMRVKM